MGRGKTLCPAHPANGGADLHLWLRLASTRCRHLMLTRVFRLRLRLDGLRWILRWGSTTAFLGVSMVPSPLNVLSQLRQHVPVGRERTVLLWTLEPSMRGGRRQTIFWKDRRALHAGCSPPLMTTESEARSHQLPSDGTSSRRDGYWEPCKWACTDDFAA